MRRRVLPVAVGLGVLVACGSSEDSVFPPGSEAPDAALPTAAADAGNGTFSGGDGAALPEASDAACVASVATAEKIPADLVFMVDRSDSMNNASKWPPCMAGLKLFLADPKSAGVTASIQYFCGSGNAAKCAAMTTAWTTPDVPLSPLPEPVLFAKSIDAQTFCSGTPTKAAADAAIGYAAAQKKPGRKIVVVLVTDGEPTDCGSVAQVEASVAVYAATIPTYVIGVGKSLTNLNGIASAGGTKAALLVDTSNPANTAKDFQDAVNLIRGSALSCEYVIPAPPDGKTLDPNAVNVALTAGGKPQETLKYDKDCAGTGWHYDDPTDPKKVLLCGVTCDLVKGDPTAKVDVAFGCRTIGGVPK